VDTWVLVLLPSLVLARDLDGWELVDEAGLEYDAELVTQL
jgi:hypothetical protein